MLYSISYSGILIQIEGAIKIFFIVENQLPNVVRIINLESYYLAIITRINSDKNHLWMLKLAGKIEK